MVARGMGATLVPAMAVDARNDELVYKRFAGDEPRRDISLCWLKSSPRERLYRHLVDSVIDCLHGESPPATRPESGTRRLRSDAVQPVYPAMK